AIWSCASPRRAPANTGVLRGYPLPPHGGHDLPPTDLTRRPFGIPSYPPSGLSSWIIVFEGCMSSPHPDEEGPRKRERMTGSGGGSPLTCEHFSLSEGILSLRGLWLKRLSAFSDQLLGPSW